MVRTPLRRTVRGRLYGPDGCAPTSGRGDRGRVRRGAAAVRLRVGMRRGTGAVVRASPCRVNGRWPGGQKVPVDAGDRAAAPGALAQARGESAVEFVGDDPAAFGRQCQGEQALARADLD